MQVVIKASCIAATLAILTQSQPVLASADSTQDYYTIGGGQPISGPGNNSLHTETLEAGVEWEMDLGCGASFDPEVTISNQLNGITEGFSNMMGDMLTAATQAIVALPGTILQRTNPDLYETMQNGVIQGKLDYDTSLTSCEAVQDIMVQSGSSGEAFQSAAKSFGWKKEMENSTGDIIQSKSDVDEKQGDDGLPYYDGTNRGGHNQEPIKSIKDTVAVGYNITMNQPVTNDSSISEEEGQGKPLWGYWESPEEASAWVTEVVGDTNWRTCTGCNNDSVPGKGLAYFHDGYTRQIEQDLTSLVNDDLPVDIENLNKVSAPPTLMVMPEIIEALKLERPSERPVLISRIAGEIALARTFEQGILARRMLATGRKEPNMANIPDAQESADKAIEELSVELNSLADEMELRKRISGNTLQMVSSRYIQRREESARDADPLPETDVQEFFGKEL